MTTFIDTIRARVRRWLGRRRASRPPAERWRPIPGASISARPLRDDDERASWPREAERHERRWLARRRRARF